MPIGAASATFMVTQPQFRHIALSMVRCKTHHSLLFPVDPELVEERRKTEDMVRQIREKLNQIDAATAGMVTKFDSEGISPKLRLFTFHVGNGYPSVSYVDAPVYTEAPRIKSTVAHSIFPAALSTPLDQNSTRSRASSYAEDDMLQHWAPTNEFQDPYDLGYVHGRRATFDESDFNRYRDPMPVWKCRHCPGVGWAETDSCDTCGRFLPMHHWRSGGLFPRPGDWICTLCSNTNWEWRAQCNRCHTCKDSGDVNGDILPGTMSGNDGIVRQRLRKRLSTHPAGVFKDNDWVCVCCGNINWDWRSKCHQCGGGKPTAQQALPISS